MDYVSLACCVLAFVLYFNTLNSGFVYDDRRAILTNLDVIGNNPWHNVFSHDFWGTPLTDTGSHGSYRPLCVLSFRLNFAFGGHTPWGFHLINNMLHCLATGLVVKIARQFLSSIWGVLITGALFAIHPIHTEAVAGIVGRADIATCICYLLAFLSYIRHIVWRSQNDQRQWFALLLTILASVAAILFKETGITALLVCGIFDMLCSANGKKDKNRKRSLCVILSTSLCFLYSRLKLIPQPQTSFSTADNPIAKINSTWTRFLTFIYLPVFNFKLLIYPYTLSFDWGMDALPRISTITDTRNILSMAFYGGIIAAFWHCYRLLLKPQIATVKKRHHLKDALTNTNDIRPQYYLQSQSYRKSRIKRKISQLYNTSETVLVMNCTKANFQYSDRSHLFSYWKHKSLRFTTNTVEVSDTKSDINNACYVSPCSDVNNNIFTFVSSNSYDSKCCCHQLMSYNSARLPQTLSLVLQKTIASVIATRSSRSSSSCSNSTTSSNKSSDSSSAFSSSSFSPLRSTFWKRNKETRKNHNWTLQHPYLLSHISESSMNACVISMSLIFLTLPFLPATNLFFYVGFVVAERLLYLPSVGFCLLIGFGVTKLIHYLDSIDKNGARHLLAVSILIVLCVLSVRTFLRNLDWKSEESLYRSAITINPPKALGNLGSVLSSQARYKEAEIFLLEAIRFRPNMADAHFNLGILYQNQQKFHLAIECFKTALIYRPKLAAAYLNLGTSLIALGKCQEAIHILQEGIKIDGTGVRDRISHENARISSYLQLGTLYTEQGKLYRAIAIYREAIHELAHNYYMRDVLHYRIGDLCGRLQKWDEAEKHHYAALNLQPRQPTAYLSYGITLSRNSSRVAEAELWFKRALKLAPKQASVHHHYAEFLTSQSRQIEAIFYRVRAAELEPNDYSLVVAAATALRIVERKQEAEMWYRKAVHLKPNDARAHTNLGAILHLLGQAKKAAASYREALKLQPGDVTTMKNLAKLGLTHVK